MDVNVSFTVIQEAIPVIIAKVVAVFDAVKASSNGSRTSRANAAILRQICLNICAPLEQ